MLFYPRKFGRGGGKRGAGHLQCLLLVFVQWGLGKIYEREGIGYAQSYPSEACFPPLKCLVPNEELRHNSDVTVVQSPAKMFCDTCTGWTYDRNYERFAENSISTHSAASSLGLKLDPKGEGLGVGGTA